jgi:cytochrome bd-type quinol oxidase subunit 2
MPENNKINWAIILVGTVLILSPYLGEMILSQISGMLLTLLFLLIFFTEFNDKDRNSRNTKKTNFFWLTIAVCSLLFGISLMFHILLYIFIFQTWLYIVGLLLMSYGFLLFYIKDENEYKKNLRIIFLSLGLFYIFMGFGIIDSMYLGIIIGLAMIGYGYLMME